MKNLFQAALEILALTEPAAKAERGIDLFDEYQRGRISLYHVQAQVAQHYCLPGYLGKPRLVPHLKAPRRKVDAIKRGTSKLHSLAFIEFKAINLAYILFGVLMICQSNIMGIS